MQNENDDKETIAQFNSLPCMPDLTACDAPDCERCARNADKAREVFAELAALERRGMLSTLGVLVLGSLVIPEMAQAHHEELVTLPQFATVAFPFAVAFALRVRDAVRYWRNRK